MNETHSRSFYFDESRFACTINLLRTAWCYLISISSFWFWQASFLSVGLFWQMCRPSQHRVVWLDVHESPWILTSFFPCTRHLWQICHPSEHSVVLLDSCIWSRYASFCIFDGLFCHVCLFSQHRVVLLDFYDWMLRYVTPHQEELHQVLAAIATSVTELTPPDTVLTLVKVRLYICIYIYIYACMYVICCSVL